MNEPRTATSGGSPADDATATATLVFVHGAWHGSWCWEQWSAAARQAGFSTASLTLPGHDRPGNPKRIWTSMRSYIAHVRTVVDAIDGPVVIVGHSMGGYVTQRLLEQAPRNLRGAVLVASVPRRGVAGAAYRLIRRDAASAVRGLLTADLHQMVKTEAAARWGFFSPATPTDTVRECYSRLQNESMLAFFPLTMRFTQPQAATVPVMVLAAEGDAIFSLRSQRRLAKAFGTTPQLVPGGHDVMLDIAAEGALHLVLDWARQTLR